MNENGELTFNPVDWEQLELLARLTPAERALAMVPAQAFVMACQRGTFARRFPELSHSVIKMKVLAYCTPIDLDYITSHVSGLDASVLQRWAELQEQAVADVRARPANTNTSERDDYA